MQTSYFGYFGHAWLRSPKMIVTTFRKLQCLSACQKQTSLFASFLRYYILKNPTIWLANSILAQNSRNKILLDIRIVIKYQWHYYFSFYIIFRKNWQQNVSKNLIWGHFNPSLPQFQWKWIFQEKRALSVFKYSNYLPSPKKSEKTNGPFLRKTPNRQFDISLTVQTVRAYP